MPRLLAATPFVCYIYSRSKIQLEGFASMVRAWRELGGVCGSQLVVLAPPYRNPTSLATVERGSDLPLGSLVFGDGDATIAVLAELTALSYRAPWAVPCLALPAEQQLLEPLLMLVTELRDRLVVVRRSGARQGDDWAHLVQCVRRRALPEAAELARWVARRLRQREVEIPLRHQFEEALQGTTADAGLSVATYSRLFAQYGKYTARDWRALGRLAAHAASGRLGERGTYTPISLRTVCEYARKYLGVPYHRMLERLGWEWVLEAALRSAGYVAPERRRSVHRPTGPLRQQSLNPERARVSS